MLWVALHVFLSLASGGGFIAFGTRGTLVLAMIGAAVGYADTSRRHEFGLLGNLGISKAVPSAIWAATMVVLEIVLRIAAATLGVAS